MSRDVRTFTNVDWEPEFGKETWAFMPYTRKDFIRLEGSTIPIIGKLFYRAPGGHLLKVGGDEGEARMTVLARYVLEGIVKVAEVHAFIQLPKNQSAVLMEYLCGIPLSSVWSDLSATQRITVKNQLCDILLAMRKPSFKYAGRPGRRPYVLLSELNLSTYDFCSNEKEWNGSRKQAIVDNVADMHRADFLCKQQGELVKTDRFVLTHGDLADRGIIVDTDTLNIVGLIDWENAIVAPTYFEYVAARLSGGHEPYWQSELLEVLGKVLEKECEETKANVEEEMARWKALVDVERYAQGLDDNCAWTFEPNDSPQAAIAGPK
ncbi:uncharacterized protein LAESUDRAFT_744868 [Laetiporus sulphureus 93-53]|uniref:Aminoglycoside phosphotransferase domain-containing protein n=1 Tax=Laetiporus sulphureus 93-53 TaxID=1314785 RepID=A0A165CE60_9APHY|nr:uncharacterized protein LAESUDRAFT_744868 [Laetiporus sulphureus 93-53]KZT02651.1 hypothetical protein LAESUDRAFT_744868 [Laetiporus sulphureus 93-53]